MNLVTNDKMTKIISVVLAVVFGVLVVTLVSNAVTTISTSITTAGDITTSAGNLAVTTGNITVGGTLTVDSAGTAINAIVTGYCTAPSISVTATSSGTLLCASATGVVSGDRVFVTATSSLPGNFMVTAASTTADAIIQIRVFNQATTTFDSGTDDTGVRAFNFWAVR